VYIYGKNVCKETLIGKDKVVKAYVSKKFKDREILDLLFKNKVRVNFVDNKILDNKVSGLHQGIVMEIDNIKTYDINELLEVVSKKNNPLVVILDHIEDPHNFGAIIRTSEALGIDGIIIPQDRAVGITDVVVKTSTGAINYVKISRVPNLQVAIKKLKDNKFWIIGTDMDGDNYTKLDYKMPVAIVIGNEGHGMSNVVKKECDFIASIPMVGKINSLNASVSCGIILSHIVNVGR